MHGKQKDTIVAVSQLPVLDGIASGHRKVLNSSLKNFADPFNNRLIILTGTISYKWVQGK